MSAYKHIDTLDDHTFGSVVSEKPAKGAPVVQWKDYLESQLDSLIGRVVLGSLVILGGIDNRLHGGTIVLHHCFEIIPSAAIAAFRHARRMAR